MILIVVDTLRADHMSLHGYERLTTPALDSWARRGTVFDQASSTSSWTLPSMSMLLTGQFQVDNEGSIFPWQTSAAQVMAGNGYRTGGVIANMLVEPDRGFDRGFEHFQLFAPEEGELPGNGWTADQVTAMGKEWIASADGPFFLLLHYFDPHDPYEPTDGSAFEPFDDPARQEAYRQALAEEHRELFDDEVYGGVEEQIALYDSEILQVDRSLDDLFGWLDAQGLADDTLVVLTADHGEGLWQRAMNEGEKPQPGFFPQLYRQHGQQVFSEQVRVPLILVGPGIPAGKRVEQAVSLIDVLPTILAHLGLPLPAGLHGRELPIEADTQREPPVYTACSRVRSVTVEGRWRLHQPSENSVTTRGAEPRLFDLAEDPDELRPLDDPDRLAAMQHLLEGWLRRHREIARSHDDERPQVDLAERRRKAAALGYIDY